MPPWLSPQRRAVKRPWSLYRKDARPEKRLAIERLGAEIVDCGEKLADREVVLAEVMASHPEAVFVPPYDHPEIIAGQGTAALLSCWKKLASLDQLWIAVGGGGLAAGTTIVANGQIDVICAEPELAQGTRTIR